MCHGGGSLVVMLWHTCSWFSYHSRYCSERSECWFKGPYEEHLSFIVDMVAISAMS